MSGQEFYITTSDSDDPENTGGSATTQFATDPAFKPTVTPTNQVVPVEIADPEEMTETEYLRLEATDSVEKILDN
jgi:hypothetical protein